ncbi:MAG: phage portal protein [Candidatus Methanomethylicaceae archaeon]
MYFVDQIADLPNRKLIDDQHLKYEEWDRYYTGEIFEERSEVPPDSTEEPPLLYPLRINVTRMMCLIHAQALLGQFVDRVIDWEVVPRNDTALAKEEADFVLSVIDQVWSESLRDQLFAELALTMMRYGGCVIKVAADPQRISGVRVELVSPVHFFPRWHPTDTSTLIECWVQYYITAKDAASLYGVQFPSMGDNDLVLYTERWDSASYEVFVGGKRIPDFSGQNPYGFVPFVYIPRLRSTGEFYGQSVIEDIMGLQDELNLRLADVGDRINYTAHPVRWVRNYRGKKDVLYIAPDHFIDLGTSIGDQHDPEIGSLDAQPEPASTLNYIRFIWDLSRHSVMIPAVALGEDEGSQRSGLTLVLRMWPLVQSAKWTRVFLLSGLKQVNWMILGVRRVRDPIDGRFPSVQDVHLRVRDIIGRMAPILPRDRIDLINELNLMWGSDHPAISVEEIVRQLGYADDLDMEVERILRTWQLIKERGIGGQDPSGASG